jgi:hypothetical protein
MEVSNANGDETANELVTSEVPTGMVCVDSFNYLFTEKKDMLYYAMCICNTVFRFEAIYDLLIPF